MTRVPPARWAAVLTRRAGSPRAGAPAKAPVMIQPSRRISAAPRMDGIAEIRVASPAARPVRNAVGKSVMGAGICSLFLFGSSSETLEQGCSGKATIAAGPAPPFCDRATISKQHREPAPRATEAPLAQNASVGTFLLA